MISRILRIIPLLMALLLAGCSVKSDLMSHLSSSILNNNDLDMVAEGAPAYLLMVDGLIDQDPGSCEVLRTGAQLYTAYADVFVRDRERAKLMGKKALGYAAKALCLQNDHCCDLAAKPFGEFKAAVAGTDRDDLPYLFTLGNAWAYWIMANRDDFNAIADIARIEAIMQQAVNLDETFRDGAAYLYLATLSTFLPQALGGKPEQGKIYFEKAIDLSKGKNLMAKVMYAKLYARTTFDRALHDRLLTEVVDADPNVPGYVLINTYARSEARRLLDGADDYF